MSRTIASLRSFMLASDLQVRRLCGSRSARLRHEYDRLRRFGNREATTYILGRPLRLSHAASFEPMHHEIFVREIFKCDAMGPSPRIIDCGAHVGMASIYLGLRHADARITAFEADPHIALLARENLGSFGLQGVEVIAAAVTDQDGTVAFSSTGDLAGRVGYEQGLQPRAMISVPTVRLASYLDEPVEFLKIDIEGAETAVLASIADRLHNVKRLFVEYHGFAAEEQALAEFLARLSHAGYRYYITNAYDFRRRPFHDGMTHCGMDLQLNIFCNRRES